MSEWKVEIHSERGPRDENQDNFLVIGPGGNCLCLHNEQKKRGSINRWPADHIRIAVADGMGGHALGREFAENLINNLVTLPFQERPDSLLRAFIDLHTSLFEKYFNGPRSPGSTLVIADIKPDGICTIGNIGDSRAYLSSQENDQEDFFEHATLLTHDHNEAEFAWRAGLINKQDLKEINLEGTSPIAQAIGFGHLSLFSSPDTGSPLSKQHIHSLKLNISGEHCDIFSLKLERGQHLTLASDGWWNLESQDNSTMIKLTRT